VTRPAESQRRRPGLIPLWGLFRDGKALGVKRGSILLLLVLQLVATGIEVLGFLSLLPLLQYIQAGGVPQDPGDGQVIWDLLHEGLGWFGLAVSLPALLVIMVAIAGLREVFNLARLNYEASVRETAVADVRHRQMRGFLRADLDYQDRDAIGDLVNDMGFNANRSVMHLFSRIGMAGIAVIFGCYIVGMVNLSAWMTVVVLAAVGAGALLLWPQVRRTRALGQALVVADRQAMEFIVERLQSARLIRLAHMEEVEDQRIHALTREQRRATVGVWYQIARVQGLLEVAVISLVAVLIYVTVAVLMVPIEQVGVFLLMLLRLLPNIKQIAKSKQFADSTRASYDAVARRLDEMREAGERNPGTRQLATLQQGIRFDEVHYSYRGADDTARALNGLSLTVPAGRITALVGPSGAGKSTLIDLLPRLRTPDEGEVLLDGVPLGDFELGSLRRGIAYAPQSPQIFNVTVAEHISYGGRGTSRVDIETAARLANAEEFIRALPHGFDTMLGEGGGTLSGGQRQRLDLARALAGRAPLLILDEPTSNLDAEAEDLFRVALGRIRDETETTIIIIAHRLSTVMQADQIAVMQAGRIVDMGRHGELIARGGWYAEAFAKQQRPAVEAPVLADFPARASRI